MDWKFLTNMFTLSLPVLEKVLRPLIIYIFLVVGLKLAGKRELASLNPLDLVVLLTISNTVQNAIIGEDNSVTGGLIGAVTLLVINYLVVRLVYRHPRAERLLVGRPAVLVDNGQICWDVLRREQISQHDLEIAANKQGFVSLQHIAQAEIEPDGAIFFQEKEPTEGEEQFKQLSTRLERIEQQLTRLAANGQAAS